MSEPAPSISAPPSSQPATLHFDNTLGVTLIFEVLVAILYGIISVQIYTYFYGSPHGNRFVKRTILFLWVLESLYVALNTRTVYYFAVTNFMNPLALTQDPWSWAGAMILGDLIESTVTSIFAYKIYKLSRSIWPLVFIVPPQFVGWMTSIAIAVLERKFPSFQVLGQRYAWAWYLVFGLQAIADCAIAITLCTILTKSRTGFRRTESLIRTLVVYSISTSALTSSVSVASVIIYATMPHNFVFINLGILLPMLMSNSLLALLNSRDVLHNIHGQVMSIHLSKITEVDSHSAPPNKKQTTHAHINVVKGHEIAEFPATADALNGSFDSESQRARVAM
ncbi:uncharacterized protein PHACADRAFT_265628, partial [Phanerochaete carnosa HHB-10118-sp]